MNIKTVWEYSMETEARRLLHCAHQIVAGFYRVNNFKVLPYPAKIENSLTVTFPDLPYIQIPRFWEQVKKIDVDDFPIQVNPALLLQIINLLEKANLPVADYKKTKILWGKAGGEILNEIYRIIPSKKDQIEEIIVYPTSFGTSSSFNHFGKKAKGKVIMYLREDQGIATITEAILTSLTREDIYRKFDGLWQESEIISDWLISESALNGILQKYEEKNSFIPTIKGVRAKQQASLQQKSNDFYKKLGLPTEQRIFNLNGLIPQIYKKPVENLTLVEKTLLKLLIQKANTTVTFDELANILFASEDDFSLWAMAKTIQRLRDKLETNGVSGSYIQTSRGHGYLLKN